MGVPGWPPKTYPRPFWLLVPRWNGFVLRTGIQIPAARYLDRALPELRMERLQSHFYRYGLTSKRPELTNHYDFYLSFWLCPKKFFLILMLILT
jgi:hypothetical protein